MAGQHIPPALAGWSTLDKLVGFVGLSMWSLVWRLPHPSLRFSISPPYLLECSGRSISQRCLDGKALTLCLTFAASDCSGCLHSKATQSCECLSSGPRFFHGPPSHLSQKLCRTPPFVSPPYVRAFGFSDISNPQKALHNLFAYREDLTRIRLSPGPIT